MSYIWWCAIVILFNPNNVINTIFIVPITHILEAAIAGGLVSSVSDDRASRTSDVIQYIVCEWLKDIRGILADNHMPGLSIDDTNYVYEVSAVAYAVLDKYVPTIPIELHGRHKRCDVIIIGSSAHILLRSTNELN